MTALTQYARLEAPGLWRDSPAGQRREVIVIFGDASIVIADGRSGRALAHWSLPAVERRNPGAMPATFAPGPDATEELELDDITMIAAISKVHSLIEARKPHPGRLRLVLLLSGLAVVAAAGLFWLPGAVVGHALRVVPVEKRVEIGQRVLSDVFRVSGAACAAPEGREALARLDARLGTNGGGIIVLASGLDGARMLPGGTVLVGRTLVEDQPAPDALAAQVLAERARATQADPLATLLRWTGVRSAFALLTTGDLPEHSIVGYAEYLLTTPGVPATAEDLRTTFADASVPLAAYARASGLAEAEAAALVAEETVVSPPPLLPDTDWVALQGICAG